MFIIIVNDDSSEDGDKRSNKKRSRPWSESSNSEGEDLTWGKKKKKRTNLPSSSSLSFKSHKGLKRQRNDGVQKSKKYKVIQILLSNRICFQVKLYRYFS